MAADPNSSVDLFKKYGMDSSLESRTAWAQERGIRTTPGSAAFGNEVHRQFTREHNL